MIVLASCNERQSVVHMRKDAKVKRAVDQAGGMHHEKTYGLE
jgi:hypothetical protein